MNRKSHLGLIALLLLLALPAGAADVTFNLANFTRTSATNRKGYLEYLDAGGGTNNALITYDKLPIATGTNGSFLVTNLLQGTYHLQLAAPPATSDFYFIFPLTNGAINAQAYLATPTNNAYPPGSMAWAATTSDGIYQSQATNQATASTGQALLWDATALKTYFGTVSGGSGSGVNVAAGRGQSASTNGGANVVTMALSQNITNGNGWFQTNYQVTIAATNIYFHSTDTVTGLAGDQVISIANGNFLSNHIGEYIIVTNASGTGQYQIMGFDDSTHAVVFPKVGQSGALSFSGSAWQQFPNSAWLPDNTGVQPAGFIGNDGSFGIEGEYGNNPNSGQFLWVNARHSFFGRVVTGVGPNNQAAYGLGFGSISNFTPAFTIGQGATYGAMTLRDDSVLDEPTGVTNSTGGAFLILSPLSVSRGANLGGITNTGAMKMTTGAGNGKVLTSDASGNLTLQTPGGGGGSSVTFDPNQFGAAAGGTNIPAGVPLTNVNHTGTIKLATPSAIAGSGLLSSSVGSYLVTNSIAAFTNIYPGSALYVSNAVYVVFYTNSATVLTLVDYVQAGWSNNATWTQSAPVDIAYNSANLPTQYRVVDGSYGNLNYGNVGARTIYGNTLYPSNSFYAGVYPSASNLRYGFGTLSPNGQGIFNIDNRATYDALRILGDNTISGPAGFTNAIGTTLNLLSPVLASAGGSFNGLTNTGSTMKMGGSTGAGYVLTDVAGNGNLSLQASTGGGSDPTKASTNAPTIWNPRFVGGQNLTNPASLSWINSTNDSTVWSNAPNNQTVIVTNGSVTTTGAGFIGSGASLTSLNASQVIAGTLPVNQLGNVFNGTNDFYGTNIFHNVVDFTGAYVLFAENLDITSGNGILLTNAQYAAYGTGGFTVAGSGTFTGNASGLTNLPAAGLAASGTLPAWDGSALTNRAIRAFWNDTGVRSNNSTSASVIFTNASGIPANLMTTNGDRCRFELFLVNNSGVSQTATANVTIGTQAFAVSVGTVNNAFAGSFVIDLIRTNTTGAMLSVYYQFATSTVTKQYGASLDFTTNTTFGVNYTSSTGTANGVNGNFSTATYYKASNSAQ
jgi:hypothetical protein